MDDVVIHNRRWWALGVLCMTLLIITLDNTILNVALPTLVHDLDASTSDLQWIVDSYALVFAGLLLVALVLMVIAILPSIRQSREQVFKEAD